MTVTVKKIETEAVIVTDEVIVKVTVKKSVTVTRKITAREALTGSESDKERIKWTVSQIHTVIVTVTLTVIERVIKVMKVTGSVKARERQ